MKNKALAQSFDISSLAEKHPNSYSKCYVSMYGNELIISFREGTGGGIAAYCYSFKNNCLEEISEKELNDYKDNAFNCTYLDNEDDLYKKSSGMIANISHNEYVYLTYKDWKVSTINIVHVKDGKETYYRVFNNN